MRNIKLVHTLFVLPVMLACGLPLRASEAPMKVQWSNVCSVAAGNPLTIQTTGGEKVEGYCVSVDVNEIAVRTPDSHVVKVARATLKRLDLRRPLSDGHQLQGLGRGIRTALSDEVGMLPTAIGPLSLAAIPPTLAYGLVAAPFCIVGDLVHRAGGGSRQIEVI